MNENLTNVIIANLPAAVDLIKSAFAKAHPDDPQPTSEEIIAGLHAHIAASLAVDDAIDAELGAQ